MATYAATSTVTSQITRSCDQNVTLNTPLTTLVPVATVPDAAGAENENAPVAPWVSSLDNVSVPLPPLFAVVHVAAVDSRVTDPNAAPVVRSIDVGIGVRAPSVIVCVPFVATIDSVFATHEAACRHVAVHGVPSI